MSDLFTLSRLRWLILVISGGLLLLLANNPLWEDEAVNIIFFIREGPLEIFSHTAAPNHKLFSMLAWMSSTIVGDVEWAYRVPSIIAGLTTMWFVSRWWQKRGGDQASIFALLLFLSSAEFFLLSAQARGYGLAYLGYAIFLLCGIDYIEADDINDLRKSTLGAAVAIFSFPLVALPVALGFLFVAASKRAQAPIKYLMGLGAMSMLWYITGLKQMMGTSTDSIPVTDGLKPADILIWVTMIAGKASTPQVVFWVVSGLIMLAAMLGVWTLVADGKWKTFGYIWFPPTFSIGLFVLDGWGLWDRYVSFFAIPAMILVVTGVVRFKYGKVIAIAVSVAMFSFVANSVIARWEVPLENGRAISEIADQFDPEIIIHSHGNWSDMYYLSQYPFEEMYVLDQENRGVQLAQSEAETEAMVCSGRKALVVLRKQRSFDNLFYPSCLFESDAVKRYVVKASRSGGEYEVWTLEDSQ